MAICVRENTSKQKVLEELTNRIQYLKLKPGEMVNENLLADELGVSRTPIREALILLARENFISIVPNKGTYVSKVDLRRVKEMLYFRNIIERKILTEFAKNRPKVGEEAEKCLVLQEYALKINDTVEYLKNDYAFHKALFIQAGHSEIWEIVEHTLMHCTRWRMLGWRSSEKDFEMTFQEHKDIAKYIESGDIENLTLVLKKHHDFDMERYLEKTVNEHREYFENVNI